MAQLYDWQKLDWIFPNMPFGDGKDGDYSSSSIPTITYRSCSGSASSTTLTLGSSGFSNGDVILVHQTRGTGAGQWEVNRIVSGGGTTSLTLLKPLQYTYTDSGASQAQAVLIPRYKNVTCSGTWNVTAWNGDVGGIFPIAIKGSFGGSGSINLAGANGSYGTCDVPDNNSGCGFKGAGCHQDHGAGSSCHNPSEHLTQPARCGEGTGGAIQENSNANGNGGGGSPNVSGNYGGGGGGGSVNAGSNGKSGINPAGIGGSAISTADLTTMTLGGGGGGSQVIYSNAVGIGGSGGGVGVFFVNSYEFTGTINLNGGNGGAIGDSPGGGGGGGGVCLIVCRTASLGSNLITALGGTGGNNLGTRGGGNGGNGGIAIHHSGTVTGTTNPTFTDVADPTLFEKNPFFLFNLI
jgi:hypothetical protein